jgi:hypothetical protein
MLEKRKVLKKMLDVTDKKDFMTHTEMRIYSLGSLLLFGLSYLITNSLDAIEKYSDAAFMVAVPVSVILVPIGLAFLSLFFLGFFSRKIIVIKDSETYILEHLNQEDASLLKKLIGDKAYDDMDLVPSKVKDKLEEIEKSFLEENTLKDFHAYLNKNESAMEENLKFFKDCLEKFNKIHNWKANEVEKVNTELAATGWGSLSVKDKSLKLVIEEAE